MSLGFPDYAGQALSFASFYLRPGKLHKDEAEIEALLMKRYPHLQPNELNQVMYLAAHSAQAAASFSSDRAQETLAEIAGVPGGAPVRVVYRARWGKGTPGDPYVYQMREDKISLDTPQYLAELGAREQFKETEVGSDPPPEEEATIELFQIDFFPSIEDDEFPEF